MAFPKEGVDGNCSVLSAPSSDMSNLVGILWVYQWGSRRELRDVYHYLKETRGDIFTGEVYAQEASFGIREDKSVLKHAWMYETTQDTPRS